MRRVVEGKVYDTATATEICDVSEGRSGDFEQIVAELYQTKKGAFFLDGWGGAATRFKKSVQGNGWVGSDATIPLTIEEARTYCEKFAPHKVENFFEVEEA